MFRRNTYQTARCRNTEYNMNLQRPVNLKSVCLLLGITFLSGPISVVGMTRIQAEKSGVQIPPGAEDFSHL
jgi:hypothetical protein